MAEQNYKKVVIANKNKNGIVNCCIASILFNNNELDIGNLKDVKQLGYVKNYNEKVFIEKYNNKGHIVLIIPETEEGKCAAYFPDKNQ
jgi:hypothetical protein